MTSKPAPARLPDSRASCTASRSTTSPRAVLIRIAPGGSNLSKDPLTILRVSGVCGQWTERISDCLKSSWVVRTRLMPSALSDPFGSFTSCQSVMLCNTCAHIWVIEAGLGISSDQKEG